LRRRQTADDRSRAPLTCPLVDVSDDLLELLAADDRAHVVCLIERIADLHLRKFPGQRLEERIEDALVDEEARAGGAGLALPREAHRGDDAVGGTLVGRVGEEDLRTLAAELKRNRNDAVRREAEDRLPRFGVSSEGDLADQGVLRKRRPDLLAGAGDHVQYAVRQVRLADACQLQYGERGVCRRLQHDGVSGAERGRHLPRRDQDRHVPGDDRRDDAVRLASRIREHLLSERNGLALQLAAEAAEVAEDVSDELRLRTRLRTDGVPGLHGERARKVLDGRVNVVRDPEEQTAAVAWGNLAPCGEGLRDDLAARVREVARAVVLVRTELFLLSDAIDRADPVAVRDRVRGLLDEPKMHREPARGRRWDEDELRSVKAEHPRALGEVAVVADVHADLPHGGVEDRVAEVAGAEVELLPEAVDVRDVRLAVLAEVLAVGVDDRGGVVVDAGLILFIHRDDQHHPVLPGQLLHELRRRTLGNLFRVA